MTKTLTPELEAFIRGKVANELNTIDLRAKALREVLSSLTHDPGAIVFEVHLQPLWEGEIAVQSRSKISLDIARKRAAAKFRNINSTSSVQVRSVEFVIIGSHPDRKKNFQFLLSYSN